MGSHRVLLQAYTLLCLCLAIPPMDALHEWLPPSSLCESTHKPSTSDSSKPLPHFPEQYTMSIEANILQDDWSYQMEEYVDNVLNRAAVSVTFNGTKTHTIFKINPPERYDVYPDGKCEMNHDIKVHEYIFARKHVNTPQPAKSYFVDFFDVSQDDTYYVGKAWVRGMEVNHWTSCQEWKSLEAYAQIDYYFTEPDYLTGWGQGQYPVRVVLNGTSGKFSSDNIPNHFDFQHIYDITQFREGPVDDVTVFQIPNDVVCEGLEDEKLMPDLPDQFEMDITMTSSVLGNSVPLYQNLRYDWANQVTEIVREFPVPQGQPGDHARYKDISHFAKETTNQFEEDWMVMRRASWVDDYHTGLQYVTEKNNNTCHVHALPETAMSHGNTLLTISKKQHYGGDKTFFYQGRSMFHGLPAESWGMEEDGLVQKVFFLYRMKGRSRPVDKSGLNPDELLELAMGMNRILLAPFPKFPILLGIVLRNRTAIDSRDMPTLVKELISQNVLKWFNGKLRLYNNWEEKDADKLVLKKYLSWTRLQEIQSRHMGEIDLRVNHFQTLHTAGDMFHVSQCYSPDQISRVSLTIKTSYATNVQHDPVTFSIAMRNSVAKAMGVSTITISDLTPSAFKDMTLVTFDLLGSPPVTELNNKQLNIDEAKKRLKDAVKSGITFSVKYVGGTQSFMVCKELYSLDSDLGDATIIQKAGGSILPVKKTEEGFSGSVVAGAVIASIIISCTLTALVIIMYLRRRKPENAPAVPYSLVKEDEFRS